MCPAPEAHAPRHRAVLPPDDRRVTGRAFKQKDKGILGTRKQPKIQRRARVKGRQERISKFPKEGKSIS